MYARNTCGTPGCNRRALRNLEVCGQHAENFESINAESVEFLETNSVIREISVPGIRIVDKTLSGNNC
jgi:hypothetical protein